MSVSASYVHCMTKTLISKDHFSSFGASVFHERCKKFAFADYNRHYSSHFLYLLSPLIICSSHDLSEFISYLVIFVHTGGLSESLSAANPPVMTCVHDWRPGAPVLIRLLTRRGNHLTHYYRLWNPEDGKFMWAVCFLIVALSYFERFIFYFIFF